MADRRASGRPMSASFRWCWGCSTPLLSPPCSAVTPMGGGLLAFVGLPWLLILGGYGYLRYWGTGEAALETAKLQRADRYARALKQIGREASHDFVNG